MLIFAFLLLLLLTPDPTTASTQLTNTLNFPKSAPCTVVYTRTGAFGCQAPKSPFSGQITFANSIQAVQTVLNTHSLTALAVPWTLFTQPAFSSALLTASSIKPSPIASVLVLDPNSTSLPSFVSTTISSNFDPAPASSTNTLGSGLLTANLPFPISFLQGNDASQILNQKPGVFAIDDFYMGPPGMTTDHCLRISQCKPLGGLSVWGTAPFPNGEPLSPTSRLVLLTARMDARQVFHDFSFGAHSTVGDIISVLAAMSALSRVDLSLLPRRIVGAVFQGEQWHRIGSRRFVADVAAGTGCASFTSATNDSCASPPSFSLEWTRLNITKFERIISLDCVLRTALDGVLHVHHDGRNDAFSSRVASETNATSISNDQSNFQDSSLQSFEMHPSWASSTSTTGLILAGYKSDISECTPYYSSELDVLAPGTNITQVVGTIADIATRVARAAVIEAADGMPFDSTVISADPNFVADLVQCLLVDFSSCPAAQAALSASTSSIINARASYSFSASTGILTSGPLSLYTSVYNPVAVRTGGMRIFELFLRNVLLNATSNHSIPATAPNDAFACGVDTDCRDGWAGISTCLTPPASNSSAACVAGRCVCGTAWYHDAWSPVLNIDTSVYALSTVHLPDDVLDPVFVEPNWLTASIVIFYPTNEAVNGAVFAAGVVLTALAAWTSHKALTSWKSPKLKLL